MFFKAQLILLSLFITQIGLSKKIKSLNFPYVQYVENYDGDTVTVNIPRVHPLLGRNIKIRVRGIDTPEMRSQKDCEKTLAKKAQLYVQHLLRRAETIELRQPERGKYFRIVADVWFDGVNLKDCLLAKKLAVPYDGGKKPDYEWCGKAKVTLKSSLH